VEATDNWNLTISAAQPYFVGINDSTNRIPLDFIGYTIENRGTNWDNGLFSDIANLTKDTVIFLTDEKLKVLENGIRNNIGGKEHNSFVIKWQFFFEDEALMTKKFSEQDINDDTYNVGLYITLSESEQSVTRNQQEGNQEPEEE
jgi:hypothetical protein